MHSLQEQKTYLHYNRKSLPKFHQAAHLRTYAWRAVACAPALRCRLQGPDDGSSVRAERVLQQLIQF